MKKILNIGGKEVGFRASALTPRLYRAWIGRDMIVDMKRLSDNYTKVKDIRENGTEEEKAEASLSIVDLTVFENVAYVMAKHYDASIPDTPNEWLDELPMLSIYEVMPELLALWQMNLATTAKPKKKA